MKSSNSTFILTSFEELKVLGKRGLLSFHPSPVDKKNREVKENPENEQRLFKEAMADVTPITRDNCREKIAQNKLKVTHKNNDAEILLKLSNLINKGEGFVIADTTEYIEGTGYRVHPEIARRLHRGEFAIEAHIDLHGLTADVAKEVFDLFLENSIKTGKRAVLVVHGRGLCSPDKPVLKTKVVEWLTRSHWRKWVMAYSSARACDGGTGATYVLLRQRPLTRRFRKKAEN